MTKPLGLGDTVRLCRQDKAYHAVIVGWGRKDQVILKSKRTGRSIAPRRLDELTKVE